MLSASLEQSNKAMKTEKGDVNKEADISQLEKTRIMKTDLTENRMGKAESITLTTESESITLTTDSETVIKAEDDITIEDITKTKSDIVKQRTVINQVGENSGISGSETQGCEPVKEKEGDETESESEVENESESESSGVQKAEKMFRTLSIETDINVAPVNWLRGDNGEMG